MKSKSTLAFATALAAAVAFIPAFAQVVVAEAPAVYRGPMSCPTKYPGSFLDIGRNDCWQCPSTHPNRTGVRLTSQGLRAPGVTESDACERPASSMFRRAIGPEKPRGLTDCRSGYKLEIFKGCYGCPSGYERTMETGAHPRACERVIPVAWTRATRKGVEGCASGSFRNGLTPHCYACPRDYVRNAVMADDLTKVNACSRIEISDALRRQTFTKFNQVRNLYFPSRNNLGRVANSVTTYDVAQTSFDVSSRLLMKSTLESEITSKRGFHAIAWLVSFGGSFGLGATHQYGYMMTKDHGVIECRKVWSNRFTGGVAESAGIIIEIELSEHHAVHEGKSEWNGWQAGAAIPPLSGGWGLHWNVTDNAMSLTLAFGPGFAEELNLSEFAHTWTEAGKQVPCDRLTWGAGWATL
jgi:hypothetical protein